MLPELARLLGYDFELAGVACVEFAQCGLVPLIKLARDLGIEWHLLVDGDAEGKKYAKAASGFLGADAPQERITTLGERDIEHCMWHAGYVSTYKAAVDANHKPFVTAKPGSADYPTQTIKAAVDSTSKRHLAYAVVAAAAQHGSPGVPGDLKGAIEAALKLATRGA
jgi:putative ATP-dependent endonuclease of OLD family